MNQALDATIDECGNVRLLHPIQLPGSRRAVVVILPEAPAPEAPPRKPMTLAELPEPRDEWERSLRAIAVDCGVSLTDEQLSREHMYD